MLACLQNLSRDIGNELLLVGTMGLIGGGDAGLIMLKFRLVLLTVAILHFMLMRYSPFYRAWRPYHEQRARHRAPFFVTSLSPPFS